MLPADVGVRLVGWPGSLGAILSPLVEVMADYDN